MKINQTLLRLSMLASLLFVTACNGGNGKANSNPNNQNINDTIIDNDKAEDESIDERESNPENSNIEIKITPTHFIRNFDGIPKAKITVAAGSPHQDSSQSQDHPPLKYPLVVTGKIPGADSIGCVIRKNQNACEMLAILPKDAPHQHHKLTVTVKDSSESAVSGTAHKNIFMNSIDVKKEFNEAYDKLATGLATDSKTFDGQVQYVRNHWDNYMLNLADDYKKSIRAYSEIEFHKINDQLRNDTWEDDPIISKHIHNIDKVLSDKRSDRDYIVSRYTSMRDYTDGKIQLLEGDTLENKAYLSTSLGEIHERGEKTRVYLRLRIPKGNAVAWVEPLSSSPDEREMLVARGSQIHVDKTICVDPYVTDGAKIKDCGRWEIFGQFLPTDQTNSNYSVKQLRLDN